MECRPLDITVLAAKGLKNVNLLSKMDVYVVATLTDAAGPRQTPQKTPVDQDAGTSPQWNFHMKFTLDEAAVQMDRLALVFTIMSDRALGDKVIGEVRVPLKELLDSPAGAGKSEKTASYVVLTPKGKKKGSLDFSYRFGDKYTYSTPEPVYAAHPAPVKGSGEPAMAYPAAAAGAGSSSAYAAYPPQGYAQPGYAYPPQYSQSHGYPQQYPPQAYGYQPAVQRPPKKSGGSKMGLGLAGGLLGGLLIGDMISDAGDMGGYDGGFDGGFDF